MINLPKFEFAIQQGWLCHRCNKVNAPFTPQCFCSLDSYTITHATKGVVCQHESDGNMRLSHPPQYKCIKCGEFYR
jgi:hypothetical protein